MIMEMAEPIFKFILASSDVCALAFALILAGKRHIRMENKPDDMERHVRRVSDRNDIVFLDRLPEPQRLSIKEERMRKPIRLERQSRMKESDQE